MPRPLGPRPFPARPASVALVALLLALPGGLALAAPAGAAGVAYGASTGTERALISLQGGREELVLGLDLAPADTPSARRPALLLPVPSTPTVGALPGAAAGVFDELGHATGQLADPSSADDDDPAVGTTAAGTAEAVPARERIGGYELTRLPAGDGAALRRWMDRSGYATPAAAAAVLRDYVARGWGFVAVRLARPVRSGRSTLSPLRIAFRSDRLIYPLRLAAVAGRPVDVELYVSGPHRVIAPGLDTYFAGDVARLQPALSAPVRDLLPGGYLTRLGSASEDPARVTSEVRPRQAVSDRLFRASADYPFETVQNFALGPLPSDLPGQGDDAPLTDAPGGAAWLLLFPAIGLSVLVVFVLLRLRERLRPRA